MISTTFKGLKKIKLPPPGDVFISGLGSKPLPKSTIVFRPQLVATGGRGGGFKPPPPTIRFKTPDLPPEAYDGPSLWDMFSKWAFNSPPEVQVEVEREDAVSEIDISNCVLLLAHAVVSAVKSLQSAAEEKAESGGGGTSQPDGVTLKRARDDLNQAAKAFAACVRKGASNHEAFCKICESEAQSLVEDVAKDAVLAKKSLVAFQSTIKTLAKAQNDDVARIRASHDKFIVDLQKEQREFNAAIRTAHEQIKKHRDTLGNIFAGATKEYTDIVKDSDGLTRVLPSVVKALEAARDRPDEASIAAIAKALKSQLDEVRKEGKKDKRVVAFETAVEKFEKKWL